MIIVLFFVSLYIVLTYKTKYSLSRLFLWGSIVGVLGGGLNVYLTSLVYTEVKVQMFTYIISIITFTLLTMAGCLLADRVELPLWWSNNKSCSKLKQISVGIIFGITIGLFLVLVTVVTNSTSQFFITMINKFKSSTSPHLIAILASIQAAFTEESIYRLFLIPLIVFMLKGKKRKSNKKAIVLAVLISSLLFAFAPTQSFLLGFILSSVVGFIYVKYGFISVLILHIVADVINVIFQVV